MRYEVDSYTLEYVEDEDKYYISFRDSVEQDCRIEIDKDIFDNLYKLFSKLIVDFIMFKHEYKHDRTIVKIINIITVLLLFLKIYAIAFFNIFITLLYTYLIDSILFTTLHPK